MTIHQSICVALGVLLAFYWGKVIAMAILSRRKSGRSANFMPPERVGRLLRVIWIPAVVAWVASPFLAAFDESRIVSPLHDSVILAGVGLVVAAASLAATLACWRRMGRAWRMGINPSERNPLIVTGAFAVVRHPIYALSSLLMIASVVVVCSPLLLAAAAIHLSLLQWEARREERHMRRVHGERYEQYCEQVGRFIPRFRRAPRAAAEALS